MIEKGEEAPGNLLGEGAATFGPELCR